MRDRRQETVRLNLLERTKASVAARIAHVCEQFTRTEFDALVTRIAEIEIKYSLRDRQDLQQAKRPLRNAKPDPNEEPG